MEHNLLPYNSPEAAPKPGHWYRYYDTRGEPAKVHLEQLQVIRETDKCVILDYYGTEKRVLKEARRRWAYPTIELARNSFEIRKRKQLGHVQASYNHIQEILARIEAGTAYAEPEEVDLLWGTG